MSFDELGDYLYNLTENALSNGDIWWQTLLGAVGAGGTAGAASAAALTAGAKLGAAGATTATTALLGTAATASSSVPVVGWIIAAVIAATAATYGAVSTAENIKTQNKQFAEAGKNAYNTLVTNLIEYSQAQQRQKQIDWNKVNR